VKKIINAENLVLLFELVQKEGGTLNVEKSITVEGEHTLYLVVEYDKVDLEEYNKRRVGGYY